MSGACSFFWADGTKAWGCLLPLGHDGPHRHWASDFGSNQDFAQFQRIRLKHIKEMLGQLNQDATGIHLLRAEEKAIEEFLGAN